LHGATSGQGRKAYQSCRFIRKTKNYNELKLSLDAGRTLGLVIQPSFAPCQRSRRSVSVAQLPELIREAGQYSFPESG
jgi:hypothetical protein